MTAELYDQAPANAESFVIAHLMPLGASPANVGAKRWGTGMPLPYRLVTRVAGADDQFSDYPTVRVHTFASTYTAASQEATRTHRRMLILVNDPVYDVVLPGGRIADLEFCETSEGPHEEPYAAESVVTRFISEYRLGLSFVAV